MGVSSSRPKSLTSQAASHEASRAFGANEFLLVYQAKQIHEKSTGRKLSEAHLVAILSASSDAGAFLPELPSLARKNIADHLDAAAVAALIKVWGARLKPARQLNVLNKAAKGYGFTSRPKNADWQTHLATLASPSRWLPTVGIQPDAALAGLLLGKLKPAQAVKQCPASREVVMRAVERNGAALEHASTTLQEDRQIVMTAVEQNGAALKYTSAALREDRQIVMTAIQQYGGALKYAGAAHRADRQVVMCAVERDGEALKYASADLRADQQVVMCAVKRSGGALEYASEALRGERQVVMCAVESFYRALGDASETLQGDREVVMHAVEKCGFALQFASSVLQNDREVVMCAVKRDGGALKYASAALQNDPYLRSLAEQQA